MDSQTKEYKLGDYRITEEGERIWWSSWASLYENQTLSVFHGKGFLKGEVNLLILGPWKVHDDSGVNDYKEVEQYLDGLPKWGKTSYYMKFADIGNSPVMLCATNKPAPDEIQKSLRDWWNQRYISAQKD